MYAWKINYGIEKHTKNKYSRRQRFIMNKTKNTDKHIGKNTSKGKLNVNTVDVW